MPPPSLARAEDGRARGDAILAVLVLEAVIVVAIVNILEKIQALRRATVPSLSSSAPTNGVTTTSPEGKDMAGGGRGRHVVFPHPDDEEAGRLLDNVGSTNVNDEDNDDTPPPPPPENDGDAPRGEGGRDDEHAGRQRDGGGGEQGCGRNERDERDRSSGST